VQRTLGSARDNAALAASKYAAATATALDVLTAHQVLNQLRGDALDALAEIHHLAAQFRRLLSNE
jgi:outer membrane protein TolC